MGTDLPSHLNGIEERQTDGKYQVAQSYRQRYLACVILLIMIVAQLPIRRIEFVHKQVICQKFLYGV